MLIALVTFTLTTVLYAVLVWLAARRIVRHMQHNDPEAASVVVRHLLTALLGRATNDAAKKPEIKRTKGTLV